MTDAGRRLPPVDRARPAYYLLQAGGYHARHQDVAGEKKIPPAELETIVQRSLATAGYLPATATGRFAGLMLARMETMPAYLASGGNLFVFPEGTRSRDGQVGVRGARRWRSGGWRPG